MADLPNLERDVSDGSGHLDISSQSSMGTEHGSTAGATHESVSGGSMASQSRESSVSGSSGHLDISSESSGGHLDISSKSSWGATPSVAAREADTAVEEAYKNAEKSISAARWKYDEFMDNFSSVKEAMTNAGSVDVDRLGSLLAREESVIRSTYGETKWKSLNMDYGVDSYTSSEIYNKRGDTLSWIKSEQRSLGLPSKQGSFERLSSWASKAFSKKGGTPDVPEHLLEAIAEDDEAQDTADA